MDNQEASEAINALSLKDSSSKPPISTSQIMNNQEGSEAIDALSLKASSSDTSIATSQMSVEERFKIIRNIGEECIQEDELMDMLAKKPQPICYDGFEPSGRMHIAQVHRWSFEGTQCQQTDFGRLQGEDLDCRLVCTTK
ncbi:PREDICTED: tyrosine--tRNA ligase 1, cytoplasmic-like [Nicotiana attenuata]|uniref:tyrosine--tRNA ligase 1, cytoplasmic-like n=1 Tax=Nicotiana attenuata TaxID=49451 RepID=UPI0009049D1E|nr:PREDICTED: tyrosine--tRNA ligase 1, cytoplasmic-like [Nicotiana attenuata]